MAIVDKSMFKSHKRLIIFHLLRHKWPCTLKYENSGFPRYHSLIFVRPQFASGLSIS